MNNTSDVWLNIEEVCSLTNSKKETIRRKCKSGEYKCRFELAGRNKNYQILLSSIKRTRFGILNLEKESGAR